MPHTHTGSAQAIAVSCAVSKRNGHDVSDMLRQVLLLQRDVPKATRFYQEGLGLRVKVLTERWAELDAGSTTLALKAVEGCVMNMSAAGNSEQFSWLTR